MAPDTVLLTGTLAEINTTLADANGVTYRGNPNFSGTDTLSITANDQGKHRLRRRADGR